MENITYFSSEEAEVTSEPSSVVEVCSTTICKIDEGICQLRLDFLTFSLTGFDTIFLGLTRSKNNPPFQVLQRPQS